MQQYDLRTALETLKRKAASEAWRPERFDASVPEERDALCALLQDGQVRFVHDTIGDQLRELVAGRHPSRTLSDEALASLVDEHLAGRAIEEYGTWVYFPWSLRLVGFLRRLAGSASTSLSGSFNWSGSISANGSTDGGAGFGTISARKAQWELSRPK